MPEKIKVPAHYYRGWFGRIYKCEVLAKEYYKTHYGSYTCWKEYKYLVRLKHNGKLKYIHENNLIEGEEEEYDI
jgi:hypothetical protein